MIIYMAKFNISHYILLYLSYLYYILSYLKRFVKNIKMLDMV